MNGPRCGAAAPEGHKFCGECGTSLMPQTELAPAGERRQLTVMFCDMVGSTAIGARLDPEDFRDVVAAYHRCVTENVTRLGGFVARYMGDGVLTYFGYPIADENDAERAVRSAIAIVEAVPRLDTAAGPPSTLRARRHRNGHGHRRPPDRCRRVPRTSRGRRRSQSRIAPAILAEPGTVAIEESTRRLIGGLFDYRDIGSRAIKGYEQPVRTSGACCERELDSRFEALRAGGAAPLFGREERTCIVAASLARGAAGRRPRCPAERRGGHRQIAPRCRAGRTPPIGATHQAALPVFAASQDTLLHPVIGQFARAAGFEREDDAAAKLRKLAALMPAGASAEEFALIADLLSLPVPPRQSSPNSPRQGRKERTFAAILRQLERLTDENPVLAIFEDLHWADPTTLELLARVVEQIERMRLLLVVTSRPDMQPDWIDRPVVSVQPLGRFDRRQANALIDGVARRAAPVRGGARSDHCPRGRRAVVCRRADQDRAGEPRGRRSERRCRARTALARRWFPARCTHR